MALCIIFISIRRHDHHKMYHETKAIPLSNLPAMSSICFFRVFVIYINILTVGIAHLINGTSISRTTWITLFHLENIVNEY